MTPLDALLRAAHMLGMVIVYRPTLETPRAARLVSCPDPRGVK